MKDELKNCEDWINNPTTPAIQFSTYTGGSTFISHHAASTTPLSTPKYSQSKGTFKIKF